MRVRTYVRGPVCLFRASARPPLHTWRLNILLLCADVCVGLLYVQNWSQLTGMHKPEANETGKTAPGKQTK